MQPRLVEGADNMQIGFLVFGILALLVRIGSALATVGVSTGRNAAGLGIRTMTDAAAATLAFWAIGAALLWGEQIASLLIMIGLE